MNIEGDEYEISPEVWKEFEDWWGDKAYRQAGMVEMIEMKVRETVSNDISGRGQARREDDEWPISREERDCYDDAAEIAKKGANDATH